MTNLENTQLTQIYLSWLGIGVILIKFLEAFHKYLKLAFEYSYKNVVTDLIEEKQIVSRLHEQGAGGDY